MYCFSLYSIPPGAESRLPNRVQRYDISSVFLPTMAIKMFKYVLKYDY